MHNTKHLEVRLFKVGCGHYVTVPKYKKITKKDIPICQVCAQSRNQKADVDHARGSFIGNLPSYTNKTLHREQIIDTINT